MFTANAEEMHGRSGYLQALIPAVERTCEKIDRGVNVIYYETFHGEGKFRIEVLLFLGGAPR